LYKDILDLIQKSHYILIVINTKENIDTIASALALSNYFNENKIKHKVFNNKLQLPQKLDFLDRFNKVLNKVPKFYDLVICIDNANMNDKQFVENVKIINISHVYDNNLAVINLCKYNYSTTSEIIYKFFTKNNLYISLSSAQCVYTGIYSKTSKFSLLKCNKTFSIVNELVTLGIDTNKIASNLNRRDSLAKYRIFPKILKTLELHFDGRLATVYVKSKWLSQTGANDLECKDVIDMILNIKIVDIVLLFMIVDNEIKVLFGSKNDIDVGNIIQLFYRSNIRLNSLCNTANIYKAKDIMLDFIKERSF